MKGFWLNLGLIPYTPAFALQEKAFLARMRGFLPPLIIQQENPPTFTIGRSGSRANVLASAEDLEQRGIQVLEVNRGGDVTYHGPGQLVISPLLYLGDVDLNANQYMHRLEDLVIEVLAGYGILAAKKENYPGVWLGVEKIAAVGIAVKHGYTFHGFSLNVSLDLSPFELINPCGVPKMPVTSMERALGRSVIIEEVTERIRETICQFFNLELQNISWETL